MEFTKLAFVDLETTGIDPVRLVENRLVVPYHEIIEVGCVLARMSDLKIEDEFEMKVRPEHPERLTPSAQEVNGFNKRNWRNAHSLEEVMQKFVEFASGSMLIGGNIAFDWSFLLIGLSRAGLTKEELDEHLYYSKRESHSFAAGRLIAPGEPLDIGAFSGRALETRLGISPESKPHRAINGARKMHETFRKAWLLTAK